mgnify:CR=1 FL=1
MSISKKHISKRNKKNSKKRISKKRNYSKKHIRKKIYRKFGGMMVDDEMIDDLVVVKSNDSFTIIVRDSSNTLFDGDETREVFIENRNIKIRETILNDFGFSNDNPNKYILTFDRVTIFYGIGRNR